MWDRFIQSTDRLRIRRPLVWCACAAGLGTLAGMHLPGVWLFLPLSAAVLLLLCIPLLRRGKVQLLVVAAAVLALFCFRTALMFDAPLPVEGEWIAEGTVLQTPHIRQNGRHVSVHLRDVTLHSEDGTAENLDGLYWTAYVGEEYALPEPGSRVEVKGRLYHPSGQRNPYGFDFSLYLRQNRLSAGLYNDGKFEIRQQAGINIRAFLVRLRYGLMARLDAAFGGNSALPKALLLGEREALSEKDREAFARVGIAHILAVSGLHVSLLAAAIDLMARRILSVRRRLWLLGVFLLLYSFLLDLRAPVVRASILTFTYLFVRTRGRSSDALSTLSLAFMAILLLFPADLMAAGFQLSFSAALGIVLLGRPVRRLTTRIFGRKAGALTASTLSAVAGTALPSIQTFHCLSVAGLVFSPVVCALLAYLLPLCMIVLALSFIWPEAARWLALPLGTAMSAMTEGVSAAAMWPYMSVNCPMIPYPFYPLIIAAIWLFSAYAPSGAKGKRRVLILAALLVIGTGVHLFTLDNGVIYIQMDADSADCAVIQDGRHTTVIDCGEDGRDLSTYLLATGRAADRLVLTHLHTDHCMGAQALMDNRIPVGELVLPEDAEKMAVSEEALALLEQLKSYCGAVRTVSAGDSWETGRTGAEVLWPEKSRTRPGSDPNDYCLCLRYTLRDTVFLLMSDLSGIYEPYICEPADILKVSHHGSQSGTSASFLAETAPRAAVISTAGTARAAQPDSPVQVRIRDAGADVFTTADCGAVRVEALASGFRVTRFIRKGTP